MLLHSQFFFEGELRKELNCKNNFMKGEVHEDDDEASQLQKISKI